MSAQKAAGASGKMIVAVLAAGMVGFVGVGSVYLPYLSPQSDVRRNGNSMGKEMKEDERKRKEKFLREVREKNGGRAPGGMWKNMNRARKEE
ncbi:hypothetical protein TrRE_jg2769 [Triparma retinervis]|uniref:Uncharacterized protein n=1 Tax=Triparma retinervis TaxID=2557542 RepID=A0A9W7F5Y9_9STRA|nr:hypothetical protein TrRE_jg2769 [Triparma retinervis]